MPDREPNVGPTGPANEQFGGSTAQKAVEDTHWQMPSPWLYLGGLVVTLSGLYGVNFGLDDPGFALITYGLAATGFVMSYVIRARRLNLDQIRTPAMIVVALLIVAVFSSDQLSSLLIPAGAQEDRFKSLQLMFAWISIIYSFFLASDAAVLFACVPCMTMLALVSTRTADPGIQNAFLAFVGAATFLMVHENYLRTRTARLHGRTYGPAHRFFGGQLQLTAFCLLASLGLANLVAVPIETVGQTLLGSALVGSQESRVVRSTLGSAVRVSEQRSVSMSSGSPSSGQQEILHIKCDRPLYWRGAIYTVYTGLEFDNPSDRDTSFQTLDPGDAARDAREAGVLGEVYAANPQIARFAPPQSQLELPLSEMQGGTEVFQDVEVVGGLIPQLYGAGEVESVLADLHAVTYNPYMGLTVDQPLEHRTHYLMRSAVPTEDETVRRAASNKLRDVPAAIRETCLQRAVNGADSTRLRALALQITRGIESNYDRAEAIRSYISKTCLYDLNAPGAPKDRDCVEWFLFDAKLGYCTQFAMAMTVMCRYADIPSRLVSGFATGDPGFQNTFTVREKDKHDWCEVFLPKVGWVPFEATLGAKDVTGKNGRNRGARDSFLAWLMSHGPLPPFTVLVVLSLLGYLVKTEAVSRRVRRQQLLGGVQRAATNLQIIQLYLEACRLLARAGLPRRPAMTADEYIAFVIRSVPDEHFRADAVVAPLTRIYERFRYGPTVASDTDVARARELVAELSQSLNRMPRRRVPASPPA